MFIVTLYKIPNFELTSDCTFMCPGLLNKSKLDRMFLVTSQRIQQIALHLR